VLKNNYSLRQFLTWVLISEYDLSFSYEYKPPGKISSLHGCSYSDMTVPTGTYVYEYR